MCSAYLLMRRGLCRRACLEHLPFRGTGSGPGPSPAFFYFYYYLFIFIFNEVAYLTLGRYLSQTFHGKEVWAVDSED